MTLVFALVILLNCYGGILCVNDNGRMKVELICQPCCGKNLKQCIFPESAQPYNNHLDCTNCFDVPTTGLSSSRRHFIGQLTYLVAAPVGQNGILAYNSNHIRKDNEFSIVSSLAQDYGKSFLNTIVSKTVIRC